MTIMQTIEAGSKDGISALIAGLESEFGARSEGSVEAHILAAEESDFCWDARVEERFVGAYQSVEEEDGELDRVAIIGCLDGIWFIGVSLVDGEGEAQGLVSRRGFGSRDAAWKAWRDGR